MSEPGTTYEGSLLLTLEEISQLVAHSHHSSETLTNIVRLIQGRFHTAVCSVYFYLPPPESPPVPGGVSWSSAPPLVCKPKRSAKCECVWTRA